MSGFGYSDWSYDPFEKMVIFPPDPLAEEDEPEFEESTTFHAQAHADHITDILTNFYGIEDMMKWITNQTADSASVNLKLAKILCIPHVNCKNHLLNNKLKMWLNDSTVPEDEINYQAHSFGPGTVYHLIHECMKNLKTIKHRVILCRKNKLVLPLALKQDGCLPLT
jgi:hypothetical protein